MKHLAAPPRVGAHLIAFGVSTPPDSHPPERSFNASTGWRRSSLLLAAVALAISAGAPARAGSWQFTITGSDSRTTSPPHADGSAWGDPPPSTGSISIGPDSDSMGVGGGPGQTITCSANVIVQVTTTATWIPDPNLPLDPAPASLSVLESASVSAFGSGTVWTDLSNGLGDSPNGLVCSGTHLFQPPVNSGSASWSRTFTALATATKSFPPGASGGISVGAGLDLYSVSVFNASLFGYSTADTANWDATHPRFFSGTNCSASATALPIGGYVTDAQLLVGGNLVNEYKDTQANPQPQHQSTVPLSVVFDSTYFADGTTQPIKLVVTDSNGNTYDGQITGLIYNKVCTMANGTRPGYAWPEIAPHLQGVVSETHCSPATAVSSTPDAANGGDKASMLGAFPTFTILYVGSHGQTGQTMNLLDLTSAIDDDNSPFMTSTDVANAISNKGIATPPYNFVQTDGCQTGCGNLLASSFGIQDGNAPDRAFLGWGTVINVDYKLENWTDALWDGLAAGETVGKAASDADLNPGGTGRPDQLLYDTTTQKWDITVANGAIPQIYGDQFHATVFNCVYLGTAPEWYRIPQ